jgi:hypothetical protein
MAQPSQPVRADARINATVRLVLLLTNFAFEASNKANVFYPLKGSVEFW